MSTVSDLTARLRDESRVADELHERSRTMLVRAAREGAAAGLSQRQISEAIGRSQPEVSRLLRFHGRTPLARAVERNRAAILRAATMAGMRNVRVFGSVSRGEDTPSSDLDLLVDVVGDVGLFDLSRLESTISKMVNAKVDVVPAAGLRPNLSEKVLAEAVPL
jgi:hypothetical protein